MVINIGNLNFRYDHMIPEKSGAAMRAAPPMNGYCAEVITRALKSAPVSEHPFLHQHCLRLVLVLQRPYSSTLQYKENR